MSEKIISAEKAKELSKKYDLNIDQLLEKCGRQIKAAASNGNNKASFF